MTDQKKFKGLYAVQFYAQQEEIYKKIEQKYPIKYIWEMLCNENKFTGSYETFRFYCSKNTNTIKKSVTIKSEKPKDEKVEQPYKPFVRQCPSKRDRAAELEMLYGVKPK